MSGLENLSFTQTCMALLSSIVLFASTRQGSALINCNGAQLHLFNRSILPAEFSCCQTHPAVCHWISVNPEVASNVSQRVEPDAGVVITLQSTGQFNCFNIRTEAVEERVLSIPEGSCACRCVIVHISLT